MSCSSFCFRLFCLWLLSNIFLLNRSFLSACVWTVQYKKRLNHINKKDNLAQVQLLCPQVNLKKSQLLLLHRFFIPTHLKFTPDNIFFLNLEIRLSFDHGLVIIIHYYTLLLIIRHQYKFHLVTKFCQEWNLFQITFNSSELLSQPPEDLE